MNTLSKLLIVVVFFASACFVTLSLQWYKVTSLQTDTLNERTADNKNLKDEIKKYSDELQNAKDNLTRSESKYETTKTQLEKELETLKTDNASLKTKDENITLTLEKFISKIDELKQTIEIKERRNAEIQGECDRLAQLLVASDAERRSREITTVQITADNQNLTKEITVLNKYIAELTRRSVAQEKMINTYKQQYGEIVIDTALIPEKPIRAFVAEVKPDDDLVVLNVGERMNVKKGMQFTVSRGAEYLGRVEIFNVYDDVATARILKNLQKGTIQVNDLAVSSAF